MGKSSRFGRTGPNRTAVAVLISVVLTGLIVWYIAGPLNGTVAVVNGRVITKKMMYEEMNKRVGAETLQAIVDDTLVMQEAALKNLKLTDEELKAEMDRIILDQYGSEESFQQLLQYYGLTRKQVEDNWRPYLTARKVILAGLSITDDDLRAYFENNRDDFDETAAVHLRQIVLETLEDAQEVLEEIKAGGDFAELAKAKSIDSATKSNGGELGWVEEGDLDEELEEVAFALDVDEISDPIETDDGFVILEVIEKREAKEAVFEEVKDKVADAYKEEKFNELYPGFLEGLRSKAKIQYR
ncbi:MAG TPA: hypothetical protein GXX23_02035 [Firmicutes bacterium]|nr:hypothetical protein [Candidatus Fermentithermobacillaceae bacterium]